MSSSSSSRVPLLQVHTVVDQPLTRYSVGRISCRPVGMEPITFEWSGPTGARMQLDETESEAYDVPPGRYRIKCTDATGARADLVVDVEPVHEHGVVVHEYRTVPASTGHARDGSVEAVCSGVVPGVHRFLWTTGVETDGPVLRDVPCGCYVASVVVGKEDEAPVVVVIHACPPAHVRVRDKGMPAVPA